MSKDMANEYTTATISRVRPKVVKILKKMAQPYKGLMSLGDIVSKAIHDEEGKGLNVISVLSPQSKRIPGGYKWQSVGDSRLKSSSQALQIIQAGIVESKKEIEKAFKLGKTQPNSQNINARNVIAGVMKTNFPLPYFAENFMPKPDPGLTPVSKVYPWQWGKFNLKMKNMVIDSIRKGIVPQLLKVAQLVPKEYRYKHRIMGTYIFHPRRAFIKFVTRFKKNPIAILEKCLGKKSTP